MCDRKFTIEKIGTEWVIYVWMSLIIVNCNHQEELLLLLFICLYIDCSPGCRTNLWHNMQRVASLKLKAGFSNLYFYSFCGAVSPL